MILHDHTPTTKAIKMSLMWGQTAHMPYTKHPWRPMSAAGLCIVVVPWSSPTQITKGGQHTSLSVLGPSHHHSRPVHRSSRSSEPGLDEQQHQEQQWAMVQGSRASTATAMTEVIRARCSRLPPSPTVETSRRIMCCHHRCAAIARAAQCRQNQ